MRTEYWRKYEINEHALDIIDTEAKAYILGFIAADGYVGKDGLGFTLHERDAGILPRIQVVLGSTHKIRPIARNRVALDISSRTLARRLAGLGLKSPKTFTMKPPTEIPQDLLHHWLRGYWDGDGWLTTTKGASGLSPIVAVAGWSRDMMIFIQELCSRYSGADVHLGPYRNGWEIKLCAIKAQRWLGRVYIGSTIGLGRKQEKANKLYHLPPLSLATAQINRRKREYQEHYAERNRQIIALRSDGMKLQDIGARFGLKPSRVCTITKRYANVP